MKILSWNVNGIRAIIKKGFADFLAKEKPDVLCLQETKIAQKDIDKAEFDFPDYKELWHPAERPGYSGTALFLRGALSGQAVVLPWDNEGRVQIIDLGKFYLANVYFPNANHKLSRLKFKLDFNDKLFTHLKKLDKSKPIIVTGDFNVAHNEIDLARPKDNIGNPGFTYEEREWMTKFLQAGFKDTFRELYPRKVQYSWWSYRSRARLKNIGWRIDYFCVSACMQKNIKDAFILDNVMGSDHCPVGIIIG